MKKFTSLLLAGVITVAGCACAVSAAAADDDNQKATIVVLDKSGNNWSGSTYQANVGDKFEVTVTGTSTNGVKNFVGLDFTTYFNQSEENGSTVEESDIDVLGYTTSYYEDGTYFKAGSFPGALFMTRPEASNDFDKDFFRYIVASAVPTGNFEPSQEIVKFTLEVKNPGTCYIRTKSNEISYMEGDDITANPSAMVTKTTLNLDVVTPVDPTEPETQPETTPSTEPETAPSTEPETTPSTEPETAPSTEPETTPSTEPGTAPSTDGPTNVATTPSTEAPTSSTNPTGNNGTNGGTNSSTNSGVNNSSTATGKVATGDSTAVALLLTILIASAVTVVFARKKVMK